MNLRIYILFNAKMVLRVFLLRKTNVYILKDVIDPINSNGRVWNINYK